LDIVIIRITLYYQANYMREDFSQEPRDSVKLQKAITIAIESAELPVGFGELLAEGRSPAADIHVLGVGFTGLDRRRQKKDTGIAIVRTPSSKR
jgi:hypothetical protein